MRCRVNPDNRTELLFNFSDQPPIKKEDADFFCEFIYDEDDFEDVDNADLVMAITARKICNALGIAFADPEF